MSEQSIYTFAKWRVKEGQMETVLAALTELAARSAAEEGNLLYQIYESRSEAETLVLFEGYRDERALEAHRNSEHFQRLAAGKILPLLAEREIISAGRLALTE